MTNSITSGSADITGSTGISGEVDERLANLLAVAKAYCAPLDTPTLADILFRFDGPPRLSTYEAFSTEEYPAAQSAYDYVTVALDLSLRSDVRACLSDEQLSLLKRHKESALSLVDEALKAAEKERAFQRRMGKALPQTRPVDMRYLSDREAFKRMIRYDAMPDVFGKASLPAEFVESVGVMGEFWTTLLAGGLSAVEKAMFTRWGKAFDAGSFQVEAMQLAAAEKVAANSPAYTTDQLDGFREGLEGYLLRTGTDAVAMNYHPTMPLLVAAGCAGVRISMISFPADTRTTYDAYNTTDGLNGPALVISSGRRGPPIIYPLGKAQAPTPTREPLAGPDAASESPRPV